MGTSRHSTRDQTIQVVFQVAIIGERTIPVNAALSAVKPMAALDLRLTTALTAQ
jgi:hypothetical protein